MKVRLTDAAIDDLTNLKLYLDRAGSPHADAVVSRILEACEKLSRFPKRGVAWRLSSGRVVWRVLAGRHLVIYEIRAKDISILRILHAHRDLRDIFRLGEPDDN